MQQLLWWILRCYRNIPNSDTRRSHFRRAGSHDRREPHPWWSC